MQVGSPIMHDSELLGDASDFVVRLLALGMDRFSRFISLSCCVEDCLCGCGPNGTTEW